MNDKLSEVVNKNIEVQKKAKELNTRAGKEVFKIMSCSEWKDWLLPKLAGARRQSEISDLEGLRLPALDPEKVERIIDNNPDSVIIDGVEIALEYKEYYSSYFVQTEEMAEEFVRRSTQQDKIVLPSGRLVKLRSNNGQSAESFSNLIEKLEESRIEEAWRDAKRQYEHTSWINSVEEVFPYLAKLSTGVEITRTNNGCGDRIFGYYSLCSDSDLDFKIKLSNSEAESRIITKTGIERLYQKATKKFLEIPKEEPWQKEKESYWSSSWELTELGKELREELEELHQLISQDTTPESILSAIELFKKEAEELKKKIGGQYVEIGTTIKNTVQILEDELQKVDEYRMIEVDEMQARRYIEEAHSHLKKMEYDQASESCQLAHQIAKNLVELSQTRQKMADKARAAYSDIESDLDNIKWAEDEFYGVPRRYCDLADEAKDTILDLLDRRQYEIVIIKVSEAKKMIDDIRLIQDQLNEIVAEEYSLCPVCDGELYKNESHYCDHDALSAHGEYSDFEIKSTCMGDSKIVALRVDYDEYDFNVFLDVQHPAWEDIAQKPITQSNWKEPSPREKKICSEISLLKGKMEAIEDNRERIGRVEITFRDGKDPRGRDQLEATAVFSGEVENKRGQNGWSEYNDQQAVFVCRPPLHWLDEQPKAGQTWICTLKFQIAIKAGMPVIVVNPQIRVDNTLAEQIEKLETELVQVREMGEFVDTDSVGDGVFTNLGKRRFQCGCCGCTTRLTKGDWKKFKAGTAIEILCEICGASGIVQDQVKFGDESNAKQANALDLSKLQAWANS